jgi:hypothetical protein
MMRTSGKCLCGSIEMSVDLSNNQVAVCHCSMCRKWSGGPMMAVESSGSVEFNNPSLISKYQSSEWAERGFCSKCGTHLFYLLIPNNQYHLPVGLLDNNSEYALTHQIFIDEKPDYYNFTNETHNMTGAEVFAHFEGDAND